MSTYIHIYIYKIYFAEHEKQDICIYILTAGKTWCSSSVSAAEGTFLYFLPQKEIFSNFCPMTDFSAMQQNFLLCNKASCCAVKLSVVY